jgi:hypothetical protein
MATKRQIKQSFSLSVNPAAELFPTMCESEFAGLKADIENYGQREPIVLFDGKILDGRNRYRACQELGIEPTVEEVQELADPTAYVLSANLHRRHLTESQRAMVAGRLKELYAPAAKERQRGARTRRKNVEANLPQDNAAGRARAIAAAAVNVSARTVEHACAVLAGGSQELVAAVEAGQVRVSKAARIVKTIPKAEQLSAAFSRRKRTPSKEDEFANGPNSDPSNLAEENSDASIGLDEALLRLDGRMTEIYGWWPVNERLHLASKLRDWANELYEADRIAAMERSL